VLLQSLAEAHDLRSSFLASRALDAIERWLLPEHYADDRAGNSNVISSLRYRDPETGRNHYVLDNLWKKWLKNLGRAAWLARERFR